MKVKMHSLLVWCITYLSEIYPSQFISTFMCKFYALPSTAKMANVMKTNLVRIMVAKCSPPYASYISQIWLCMCISLSEEWDLIQLPVSLPSFIPCYACTKFTWLSAQIDRYLHSSALVDQFRGPQTWRIFRVLLLLHIWQARIRLIKMGKVRYLIF